MPKLDFVSIREAAKYLGISGQAVRKAIKEGRLNAGRIGKVHIIRQGDRKNFIVHKHNPTCPTSPRHMENLPEQT